MTKCERPDVMVVVPFGHGEDVLLALVVDSAAAVRFPSGTKVHVLGRHVAWAAPFCPRGDEELFESSPEGSSWRS